MSTIKVNTLDSTTGSSITVPTGKSFVVTDTGALTIGGTAITTGAQGVISKTSAYTILAADFTGKSSLIVFVDVSAGTSTTVDIVLPAVADFSTCAIHVVSTAAHGAGNSVVIKLGAAEQFTLYKKGDHCEFVSDATNVFRTGNEHATIRGDVVLTANATLAASAMTDVFNVADAANYAVTQTGGGWNSTTDDFIAPFDGLYAFGGYVVTTGGLYGGGWNFHDGTAFITENSGDHLPNPKMQGPITLNMSKDDKVIWYGSCHSTAGSILGAASGGRRSRADFWMIRRY